MNFPLESMAELPEEARAAFMATLEHMQVRDSLRLYNSLVERCFRDCVDTFKTKNLDSQEEKCVARCTEKFLNLSARTGLRFQELFSQMEQQAQASVQQQQQQQMQQKR